MFINDFLLFYFFNFLYKKIIDIKMSMRFLCPKCRFKKVTAKDVMDNINYIDFNYNIIFKCPNCNI